MRSDASMSMQTLIGGPVASASDDLAVPNRVHHDHDRFSLSIIIGKISNRCCDPRSGTPAVHLRYLSRRARSPRQGVRHRDALETASPEDGSVMRGSGSTSWLAGWEARGL